MQIVIGIDIGQSADPTAVAVVEQVWRPTTVDLPSAPAYEDHHLVRHLERLLLGTKYDVIAERLKAIVDDVEARVRAGSLRNRAGWLEPTDYAIVKVFIDATGVGKPVVDMMRRAGCRVTGVYFTHGDKREVVVGATTGELRVNLGKAYMVSRLQVLLQTGRLHLPRTEEAEAAALELQDYEIRVNDRANEIMGAFRVGAHDDLVTAIGLATNEEPSYYGVVASTPGTMLSSVPPWAGGPPNAQADPKRPATLAERRAQHKLPGAPLPFVTRNWGDNYDSDPTRYDRPGGMPRR